MTGNREFKEKLINRAFNLAKDVIRLVDKFPKKRTSWVISDQLLRAITSIGANIIEAQAASSRRDFINFLHHSLKSGNESLFWLKLSKELDTKLIKEIERLEMETLELVKILNSSLLTLKGRKSI
jgi:four helix bundle protein